MHYVLLKLIHIFSKFFHDSWTIGKSFYDANWSTFCPLHEQWAIAQNWLISHSNEQLISQRKNTNIIESVSCIWHERKKIFVKRVIRENSIQLTSSWTQLFTRPTLLWPRKTPMLTCFVCWRSPPSSRRVGTQIGNFPNSRMVQVKITYPQNANLKLFPDALTTF